MQNNKTSSTIIISFWLVAIFNLTAVAQVVSTDTLLIPQFSIQHGLFNNPFNVIVSAKTKNASVKYTLDYSDPATSSTAMLQYSPATIRIDPESTIGERGKTPGVILRARIISENSTVGTSVTQTYLFVNKVNTLSPDGIKPGTSWPNPSASANPQMIDYGMDPDILNDSRYKDLIDDALLAIPSISVTTELKNLFDSKTGIYFNAGQDGLAWERPASIELIYPDGKKGFQINAGLRIRGGASRSGSNPKHAFRFFFRSEYGKTKLDFPLFEDEGIDEFDNIDLRTSQNYSWSFPGHLGEYNTMNRDVFSRDLQRELGQPYTRSRYYHLYLNGCYWGIYQTQERPEASFAASYFGGMKEDYDAIKADDGWPASIETTDGNLNAFQEVWNLSVSGFGANTNYFKLQGLNPDGTRNSNYKVLVDIDNLIDYMLIVFFTGNFDCPTTKFDNDKSPRNFYGIYNRNGNDGFKFIMHDAEHALRTTSGEGPGIGLQENRVNIGDLSSSDIYKMTVTSFNRFHPQWLHYRLSENIEYRIRIADHVYKHFFNQGCMTPEKATALFLSRAKEIEMAIIAESARWGDTYRHPARNKDNDWLWAINDIVKNYFPYRTNIVLNQLSQGSLYPTLAPPTFKEKEVELTSRTINVSNGFVLKIQKPANQGGIIQYTINGEDPRMVGGNISVSTLDGGNEIEIPISRTTVVKARVRNVKNWSALHEIILFTENNFSNIKLTEINYHPIDGTDVTDNKYEFLEMKNISSTPVNLSYASFVSGIEYTFPSETIVNPNQFIVLASNRGQFNNRYGFIPFGEYSGQLDNGGEKIILVGAAKDTIFSISYDDKSPWPELADGGGYSLVPKEINPVNDLNDANNWRTSYSINGSPGKDDLTSTSVENFQNKIPTSFRLEQNYPNPFNPETVISYQLSEYSKVSLKVYDLLGREILTLVDEYKQPGIYHSRLSIFNTTLSSGIYFCEFRTAEFSKAIKMVLLK